MSLDLNTIWFLLVGTLFAGYAVLDGFDLGVGMLHLFARTDRDRRTLINAIGPVWDGNEVWLVTAGGALFAAFPQVYATVFSGFYLAFIFLLFALIFRAVAIEFRSKQPGPGWRRAWDGSFFAGSTLAALLIGVTLGNLVWGVPLDARGEFAGNFWTLLKPYTLLTGITTLALFAMHGAIYLAMKTDGELQERVRGWMRPAMIAFIVCYATTTMATLLYVPHMTDRIRAHPEFFVVALAGMLAIANIPREVHHGRDFRAFLSSGASVLTLLALFGIGMYPDLVYSNPEPAHGWNIHNAASSPRTLRNMLIIAACGVPLVVAYTASIYWIFRGKVKLDETSY
jgi:cytochrome bd ubiquinol oxidase subunit II